MAPSKWLIGLLASSLALSGCGSVTSPSIGSAIKRMTGSRTAFSVTSSDFAPFKNLDADQAYSDASFGCVGGGNRSPSLLWQDAPAGTKSFAITAFDPDAPTGSGWWHWIVVNLPSSTTSLPTNAGQAGGSGLPIGAIQIINDYGLRAYGGPCPPFGERHRYQFTVWALKVDKLDVGPQTPSAVARFQIHQNALSSTTVVGYYGR